MGHGAAINDAAGHKFRRATVPTRVFLLCATIIGAGILSLPHAFELMGIILGSIIVIVVGILTAYSSMLLMQSGIYVNVTSYEVLGDVAFPKYGSWMVAICIILSNFGSLTAYVVILGDLMHPAILGLSGANANLFWVNRNFIIVIFIAAVIYPLCLLRNIATLDRTSVIAVCIASFFCSVIFIRGCIALAEGKVNWDKIVLYDFSFSFFKALSILSLAYACQSVLYPTWKELKDPTLPRMSIIIKLAMFICGLIYFLVSLFGYLTYDVNTQGNIFQSLSQNTLDQTLRILYSICILFHYPLIHYGIRTSLEERLFKGRDFSIIRHVIETTVVVILSILVAIALPDLSDVFSLTGALTAFPISFIFPTAFYLKIQPFFGGDDEKASLLGGRSQPGYSNRLTLIQKISAWTLLIASCICCVISVVVTCMDINERIRKQH